MVLLKKKHRYKYRYTYIYQTIRIRFSGFLKSLITREANILSYSQSWIEPEQYNWVRIGL